MKQRQQQQPKHQHSEATGNGNGNDTQTLFHPHTLTHTIEHFIYLFIYYHCRQMLLLLFSCRCVDECVKVQKCECVIKLILREEGEKVRKTLNKKLSHFQLQLLLLQLPI